ncbi:MAG: metallophosphoesterase [Mesorhizobium sp.]
MQHLFAIIADPHLHDVRGSYRLDRIEATRLPGSMELRTLADTLQSTRLYNESEQTFRGVLDDIASRGVRHVILVGDYSDDGQDGSVAASLALMRSYAERFGMRFYSTVGNHDVYGYSGRSLDRDFLLADGSSFCVSGAKPDDGDRIVFNPAMCCRSYEDGLPRDLGFFRRAGDLHWETPFGASDALEDRTYTLASPDGRHVRRFIDASYLVEPVEDVWLLSIDANVFAPRDGDAFASAAEEFDDSTDAGYNALVKHRPYLVKWIADASKRAKQRGKRLISFAHYPAVDPFDGTFEDERRLFGQTIFVRRTPNRATTDPLAEAGLGLHFSGHLHIDNVTRHHGLTNVAVPSTAGYPGGYRLLSLDKAGALLETVRVPRTRARPCNPPRLPDRNPTLRPRRRRPARRAGF